MPKASDERVPPKTPSSRISLSRTSVMDCIRRSTSALSMTGFGVALQVGMDTFAIGFLGIRSRSKAMSKTDHSIVLHLATTDSL